MTTEVASGEAIAAATDGRSARRDRNRLAVLDAVIELFTEGNFAPGPDEVAARVGLSVRSVYRYFEDQEALVRAAIDRNLESIFPLYLIHAIGEGPLDERIECFVTARLRLHDTIGATARAARVRATSSAIIRDQVEVTRVALQEQVEKQFAPELAALAPRARWATGTAVDVLCQLPSLDQYRIHRGLSTEDATTLLVDALTILLHPN